MQGWQCVKGLIHLGPIFRLTKSAFLRAWATLKGNTITVPNIWWHLVWHAVKQEKFTLNRGKTLSPDGLKRKDERWPVPYRSLYCITIYLSIMLSIVHWPLKVISFSVALALREANFMASNTSALCRIASLGFSFVSISTWSETPCSSIST